MVFKRHEKTVKQRAQWRTKLKEAGLRTTAPRMAVLRYLETADLPVSHSELVRLLSEDGFDRVTIYRNLKDLAEAGLVARTDLGDHTWRFELQGQRESHLSTHPHFTCTSCGTVSCLPQSTVDLKVGRRMPWKSSPKALHVYLQGVCSRCD
jgi:Fur family ferric uptake transcriptional regulator